MATEASVRADAPPAGSPSSSRPIDFVRDVQPLFAHNCYKCHGTEKQKGGLRLDVRDIALRGGDDGLAIVPGHSDKSPLLHYIAGDDPDKPMPPKGPMLTPEQVGVVRAWIDSGAPWPTDATAAVADKKDHWAYKPIGNPAPPAVKDGAWVRTPIDAFVLAKLEEKGLTPAPSADKRTLLRRLCFDLTGLPPTPEQLAAFVADNASDAYEKEVDRLLASPHYGERWARHWMDLVHFAETHGNDQDRERPHAWPYRDYLIQSFNDDKPYARFVQEQVAGDALFPDDPQGVVALGFIAAGPWDESSQRDIRDDTVDKKIAQNLDRDDMVAVTMNTFVSSTVQCARCHNHKFDPISQNDYYSLQADFAGVDRANRSYDADARVFRERQALLAEKRRLDQATPASTEDVLKPAVQAEVAAWEQSIDSQGLWTPLSPQTCISSSGATLTRLPDDSILSGGPRPETDTYTITATTALRGITGVRVELMTDPSLPHNGPGRQDNGNLHVNEFFLKAAPASLPGSDQAVELSAAHADFDQDGWTIAMAIDRKPDTAWGIYPQIGKPHVGVFELRKPIGFDGGTRLTFVLEQTHGGGHLIGRLRLSVTTAPLPIAAGLEPLPASIARIIQVRPEKRTDSDRSELAIFYLRQKIDGQLKALPPEEMVYAAASHFTAESSFRPADGPRSIFVLQRGDIAHPGESALPGTIGCVPGLASRFELNDSHDESLRRAALAKWLTDPKNCLTWRSIVNRTWQYHFGPGIVSTPSDFGHMGTAPTHPELLDWLAQWFLEHGGSLKQLTRLIVTSNTYRQSCRYDPAFAKVDADNQLLWRMNRTRLEAECVRDAMLQVSGLLDTTMGGPSAKQFNEKPGIHVTPVLDYSNFDVDSKASRRLSIYRFVFRTLPDPFLDAMDCPDAAQLTPTRNTSMTALQALALLNDRFVLRYCEHLAERVAKERTGTEAQVGRAFELCTGKPPAEKTLAGLSEYAAKYGMANACRVIVNSDDFLFVN